MVASHRPGDGGDHRRMTDDAVPESLLEREEAVAVRLQNPFLGDSGKPRDRAGDVVARYLAATFPPGPGAGEIDGRKGLVGKAAVVHVSRGEERRRFQRLRREPHSVVLLVPRR